MANNVYKYRRTNGNYSILTLEKSRETAHLWTSLHITYQLSSSLPKNIVRPEVNLQTRDTINTVQLALHKKGEEFHTAPKQRLVIQLFVFGHWACYESRSGQGRGSNNDMAPIWRSLLRLSHYNWHIRVPYLTIFYGHYRSIFNHCDVTGQHSDQILFLKMQNKNYYAVQGHSRSPRSVSIESPYATSY